MMKKLLGVSALSLILAGPAFAMNDGELSQLEKIAADALETAGIEYPVTELSPTQLTEIKVLSEKEDGDIELELRQIVGKDAEYGYTPGVIPASVGEDDRAQLEAVAERALTSVGIDHNVESLTLEQLVEIKQIIENDQANNEYDLRLAIERDS